MKGRRTTRHPVRDEGFWASFHRQRGNADDALMRHLHGRRWRARIGAPGRVRRHLAHDGLRGGGRAVPEPVGRAAGWAVLTARFAWSRIAPGPRTASEVVRMAATSVVIPPAACQCTGCAANCGSG